MSIVRVASRDCGVRFRFMLCDRGRPFFWRTNSGAEMVLSQIAGADRLERGAAMNP